MAFSLFRRKKDKTGAAQTNVPDPENKSGPDIVAEPPIAPESDTIGKEAGSAPVPAPALSPSPPPTPTPDEEGSDEKPPVEEAQPDTRTTPDVKPQKKTGMFARFRGERSGSSQPSEPSVPSEHPKKAEPKPDEGPQPQPQPQPETNSGKPQKKPGMFARLKGALGRTRAGLVGGLSDFFRHRKTVDENLVEEIENLLLTADVGVDATERIVSDIGARLKRRELKDPEAVFRALRENMLEILAPVSRPLAIPADRPGPFVLLVVGVNGTGKTTTIGKLAKRLQAQNLRVMLAAGDTFRAAAVEQLQIWGERNDVPVIAQKTGADSASVIYDALQSARARQFDVLIADTAGRLHTQVNLMEELKKVHRVITKLDGSAPHETLLVLDAGTGQNALAQARQFHETLGLTGLALTKLDGTAKGGIIFALAQELALPVRFIGVGEGIDDLREFDAGEFIEALFS